MDGTPTQCVLRAEGSPAGLVLLACGPGVIRALPRLLEAAARHSGHGSAVRGCREREGQACSRREDSNARGSFGSTAGSGAKLWSAALAPNGDGLNSEERPWARDEAAGDDAIPPRLQFPVCSTAPAVV
ncbi:hypothetical protein EK904_011579 [Melospiza melodia maxima]|nr:hypothetical protein EK904_011579 [Melospiza melodia maxima]